MKCVTFTRGRYVLMLHPPVVWLYDPQDDWPLSLAWGWRAPRRWRFPEDAVGGTDRPVLVQGVCAGPVDWRRVSAP